MHNRGRMKINITQKRAMLIIVILSLIILSVIPLIRLISGQPIMIGEKPYYDARIAKTILEKGVKFEDNLILDGREYTAKPYHLFLIPLAYFSSPELYLTLMHFFTGIISIILFHLILKRLNIGLEQRFFTLIILLLSPAFLFTFGTSNEFCISIMLLLFGLFVFLSSKKYTCILSLFIFSISIFLNIINLPVIIFLLLFLSEDSKTKKRKSNIIIALILFFALLYYTPFYFQNNIFAQKSIVETNRLIHFISDFGGLIGLSIFTLILSLVGMIIRWKEEEILREPCGNC